MKIVLAALVCLGAITLAAGTVYVVEGARDFAVMD